MKKNKNRILLVLILSMFGTKALAYDFAADNTDGVTLYYNYINDGTELEVTYSEIRNLGSAYGNYSSSNYTGIVNIPEEVTFMGRTRKVTSIGEKAFYNCRNLTSVTIPMHVKLINRNSFYGCSGLTLIIIPQDVTYLGYDAFKNCTGLTSITIPPNVRTIKPRVFDGCVNLSNVVSLIENPFEIYGVSSSDRSFDKNTFYNAILFVPSGTIEKYKKTNGWKDFYFIEEGTAPGGGGDIPGAQKCAIPTICYKNGKLTFNSETDGVTFNTTIVDPDIKSYSANEIQLGVTYNISVYATKNGYQNSETATATLCWIDVGPRTEGITNDVASIRSIAVMIQNEGGMLTINGAVDNTSVAVYDMNGIQVGSAISINGVAYVNTNLSRDSIAIVKIGNKSVKVIVR